MLAQATTRLDERADLALPQKQAKPCLHSPRKIQAKEPKDNLLAILAQQGVTVLGHPSRLIRHANHRQPH